LLRPFKNFISFCTLKARLRAIQQLLSIPAGDPQAADHWVDIRKYLLSAFKDPNEKIAVNKLLAYFIFIIGI